MPVDRDKVLQAAQKLVEKKRYDKAIVEYQKLVADDPKDVRTLLKIGDLHLKMEQHVDAITTYERVGQFYSAQGFALKAIAVYKQIREIIYKHVPHMEDRFGHIVPRLAEIYTQLGLTSDALAAHDEVATRYQRAGRDRDAIDVFRKIVELDPTNPLPHLRLAEAHVRVRDVDNAIQRFGVAVEILLKLGRRDDALKVVERLLQHRADTKFARIAVEIYLERGEPSDGMAALTKLQICFKENPKDLETLGLLARTFDKLGQPSKSVEVQKEAARIAKDAGKLDHFNALVEALVARAPNDDGVKQLAAMRAPSTAPAAPSIRPAAHDPQASIDVEVDEAEVMLDEDDAVPIESEAAPFVLRQSIPPAAATAAPVAVDPAVRARQIIAQAEALRRNKGYDQAVALLVESVEELPGARDLREKLCDILIEAGDQAEAVRQMLGFARWLGSNDDVDGAARLLDEVLLLEPGQADALNMLRELGYAVQADDEAPHELEAGDHAAAAPAPYDPNAPLPSYDLEEIGAVDATMAQHGPHGLTASGSYAPRPFALDDPFDADLPLPSFPIEDEATEFAEPPPRESTEIRREPEAEAAPLTAPGLDEEPPQPEAPAQGGQLDEEALEEVEFFASHGMFDEARSLLDEQLQKLPNHPLLIDRRREIDALAARGSSGDGSGTRAVPRASVRVQPAFGAAPGEDRSFDIAASLDALDALDAGPPPSTHDDTNQVSVESVFEQFKAGVAAQISESDAATHYDLGVAYKEMGLYTDAIAEFDLASRDPGRECVCQSMVGMIYLQLGNVDAGIDAFIRGLHATVKTREQEIALTYEIGDAYESRRSTDQALYYFQRVARIEAGYRDPRGAVADRIRRLEMAMPKPSARAVGADEMVSDEFDAALDDLLGGGKLP